MRELFTLPKKADGMLAAAYIPPKMPYRFFFN
jgi:hypothetical protein